MLHNNLPFQVILHFENPATSLRSLWHLYNFCQEEQLVKEERTFIVEYQPVEIEFLPAPDCVIPEGSRLFLDGLDAINAQLQSDWDGPFLSCPNRLCLYKGGNNTTDYPWIPGCYRVTVIWGKEKYFTTLRVKPRHVSEDQLELMCRELEGSVRGLAIDVVLRNQGTGKSNIVLSLPERLHQYSLLENEFPRLYQIILDVLKKPHQQARREHKVVPVYKARAWDDKTLKWLCSDEGRKKNYNPQQNPQFVLAPRGRIKYDLPENRWVKAILKDMKEKAGDIQNAIENTINFKKTEPKQTTERDEREISYLKKALERCKAIQGQLTQILDNHLFEEVQASKEPIPITMGLLKDFRYWHIYRFWLQLCKEIEVTVESALEYQWKRTELLYEYWCFVRTIECLQEVGFTPVDGWIFARDWNPRETFLVPHIKPGTSVTLVNANMKLILTYNQSISYTAEESKQRKVPVWSKTGRNLPDLRLDIYKDEKYLYSIILDSKYSRQKNVWNNALAHEYPLWNKNMQQLNAYKIGLYHVDDWDRNGTKHVIALYAGMGGKKRVTQITTHQITLVQLIPGTDKEHFKALLEELVY